MSPYTVYIIPSAWPKIKELPGHIRQRVKRAVDSLADNPRPAKSKELDIPDFGLSTYPLNVCLPICLEIYLYLEI